MPIDQDMIDQLKAMNTMLRQLNDSIERWRAHTGSVADFSMQVLTEVKGGLSRIEEKLGE